MNKRIILIDDDPALGINLYQWFGSGQTLVYTLSQLSGFTDSERDDVLDLRETDAAILVGPGAFRVIHERYHIGIRGENYFDCSHLRRIGLDSGAFIKVYHESDKPDPAFLQFWASPDYTKKRTFSGYTWNVVKTYEEALPYLKYFMDLDCKIRMGFDYETSGMPMEVDLIITGAAICANRHSVFFSFTEIHRNSGQQKYELFMAAFGDIFKVHAENMWTYNLQFEQQVTWRFWGLECEFPDTSVLNVEDGLHSKNYSLKWSIQRLLGGGDTVTPGLADIDKWASEGGIVPWDTDFDRLGDLMDSMFFEVQQIPGTKGKKSVEKVLKVTPDTYQGTQEWSEICRLYPGYVSEFERLIQENFGKPFCCIPADILGYYCCLDAFYTVEAIDEHYDRYTPVCHEVFLNNLKLGALLHRGGMFKDETFRASYEEECRHIEAYGITYCATARCYWKMAEHRKKMANPKKYNPLWLKLMNRQEFHNGDPLEITKTLLANNINEAYDTGFDEGRFMMIYGEDFAAWLSGKLADRMKEIKFKGKIDSGIVRKKKLLGLISEDLKEYLGLPEDGLGEKHTELEKFMWYERAYKGFLKIWNQGFGIDAVPKDIWFLGKSMPRDEYTKYVMDTFFKCSSPIDSAKITKELIMMFPSETTFLTTIYSGINKLPDGKNFYGNLEITDPETAYNHFMQEWQIWWNNSDKKGVICTWPTGYTPGYPMEIWRDAYKYWGSIGAKKEPEEDLTTTWDSFDGYLKQSTYFKFKDDWDLMRQPYTENDWNMNRFDLMRKLLLHIMLYKKYRKMRTAYTAGGKSGLDDDKPAMFCATDREVIVDPKTLMPIRYAVPGEPGAMTKMFPHYEICKKETKRWSSG